MDGKGGWMEHVVHRAALAVMKYGSVYIHALKAGTELRAGLGNWIGYYNADRPHSALGGATPDEAYGQNGAQPDPGLTPDQADPLLQLAA